MTSNRRTKTKIRRLQAQIDAPYSVARRHRDTSIAAAETENASRPGELLPPLKSWTRPVYCTFWNKTAAAHGPLMAVVVSRGPRWWELDDVVRKACGALDDRPAEERDLWIAGFGRYSVTKREHLPAVLDGMRRAGALSRLTVRAVPDGAHCDHTRCRRDRGESVERRTATPAPRSPAGDSTALGPLRTLTEVMEQHPQLSYFGIGIFQRPGRTPAQRRAELDSQRRTLAEHQTAVMTIATWLRDNVNPIKTTPTGSYDMKHIVENATGTYVSNGELIAAALIANYPHRYTDGPNVRLGMSRRDVDRLRTIRPSP